EIKLPLLETQEKIASILSALDDKIELNNEMNKTLEEMAQTLFKRWFIDFDFPNENGEPYRSSGGKMVDSELGEIPEGWEVLSLLDIANYLNGLAMQKYRPKGHESIKVIKIREMNNGFSLDSDLCCTTIPEKYKIKNGDILFSWSGTLKLMLWNKEIGGLNQHIFKVTSEKFEKWFIYLWTKFHLNNFIHVAESRATTMGHIKRQNLKEAKVIVPRKDMILKMDKIMIPILEDIINYNEEIQSLTEIRDTLLPKLMSGEVEV
ncbi:MAG: restriction endonuclease subunit S, partial [Paraclostridium sp.]